MLFKTINNILTEGCTATLVVTKAPDGNLSVATSINNTATKDPAKAFIQPFIVTGSPEELDAELPALLETPLKRSSELQTSMAQFEAAAEIAAAKSKAAAAEKAEAEKAKKQQKAAFDKSYTKAEALEKEGKLREAAAAYQQAANATEGPDKAKAEKKAKEVLAKDQPSFGFFDTETETTDEPDAEEEGIEIEEE